MAPGPPYLGNNRFAELAEGPKGKRKKKMTFNNTDFSGLQTLQVADPKFIVVAATDTNKPLNQYSCFAVKQALELIHIEFKVINDLRDGNLLLLVKDRQIAQKFLKAKTLHGICDITVKYHENLNCNKGTVYAPCLSNIQEEEIVSNLSSQGVISAYKFQKTMDGTKKPSGVVLLTFDLYHLPECVDIAWHRAKVRQYVPNPMRCKNCQILGHTAKYCKQPALCETCALPPHPNLTCTRTFCINCCLDHPASSNSCPKYTQNKEILKIKITNKCSMREALKLYKDNTTTTSNLTFAQVMTQNSNKNTTFLTPTTNESNQTNLHQTSNLNHTNKTIINKDQSNTKLTVIQPTTTTLSSSNNTDVIPTTHNQIYENIDNNSLSLSLSLPKFNDNNNFNCSKVANKHSFENVNDNSLSLPKHKDNNNLYSNNNNNSTDISNFFLSNQAKVQLKSNNKITNMSVSELSDEEPTL